MSEWRDRRPADLPDDAVILTRLREAGRRFMQVFGRRLRPAEQVGIPKHSVRQLRLPLNRGERVEYDVWGSEVSHEEKIPF
jgi:hypothetical protein